MTYYAAHPELSSTLASADRIMPHFAVNVLPVGARGLLVAGIFAATMANVSAAVNSLSAVTMKDSLVRFGVSGNDERQVTQARWITLAFGVLITIAALYVGRLGSVLAIIGKLQSFFMGPICALFTLGVISKRANSAGVIIGGLAGLVSALAVANLTSISWLWWIVVGFATSMFFGYLCSRGWAVMRTT